MSNVSTAGAAPAAREPVRSVFVQLSPLVVVVFIAFFMVGLPMPVLPLYVTGTLMMSALVVGVVIGWLLGAAAGVLYVLADILSARPQGALTPRRPTGQ